MTGAFLLQLSQILIPILIITSRVVETAVVKFTSGPFFFRPCLVYFKGTTLDLRAIELGNCFAASRFIRHFNETKTTGVTGDLVHDNPGGTNFAERSKKLF